MGGEERDEEREMVDHWSHEHPLTLVETHRTQRCYGCSTFFRRGEKGYGCSQVQKCGAPWLLHEECAEAPRKIRHAMHPQHILTQQIWERVGRQCSICQRSVWGIFYTCTRSECTFGVHIKCAQGSDIMYAEAEDDEQQSSSNIIHHPSHPNHGLRFMRRSCSFKCDACGATRRGSSYLCTNDACEYWIHERCASLPHTIQREYHNHSLSLSFHFPSLYLRYEYSCEVCTKILTPKHWIYHCELCSYAVHLTCAFTKYIPTTREKGIMEFPINDAAVGEDLIGDFLIRQGLDKHSRILDHQDDVDYEFHNHKLTLVSSLSSSFQEENEEENSDDDDDEEDYSCRKSELICDGCITPIFLKKTSSSSSSSSSSSGSKDCYYMRCSMRSCKYYLHLACFQLPTQLSSLPLLHRHGHNLVLQSGDKLKPWEFSYCSVCRRYKNGLFFSCTKCDVYRVDIKCASMPATIYHAAHPHHSLNLVTSLRRGLIFYCDACDCFRHSDRRYTCGTCDFNVEFACAVLPASTTSRRWDKHHPLLLTHDATLNHPGDFYCNQCEKEMNPKSWMYHCRDCDLSFHPYCIETPSHWSRPYIKFGQKYVMAGAHCHPLTFQILTTKRRCDVCGEDRHELLGFYCASCVFFICFEACTKKMIEDGNVEAID